MSNYRRRHLDAVDEWLAELEQQYGPVPSRSAEWAAAVVERWARRYDKNVDRPPRKAVELGEHEA